MKKKSPPKKTVKTTANPPLIQQMPFIRKKTLKK